MHEREIFIEALQKDGSSERAAFLDAACDDPELRRRVEQLIAEHERQDSFFLDAPPPGIVATLDPPPIAECPGQMIGRYKLLEQIGEGGMGVVYMAEQREPVRRKVALKIIKPGMDTRQVVARFEAERQALALMDHPNIAKVLDGGTTEPPLSPSGTTEPPLSPSGRGVGGEGSGRPYFVMELVHGIPLTEYCDRNQLTTRQRLELFVQVCHAVQHAHTKGIIHRDLKPSNVLVTLYDRTPVPKIIDFGVAKATSGQLGEKTVFTGFGQVLGTPLYMSPEQAELSAVDVDTRSDIYSLGVLLYELLTGSTPLDKEQVREAGIDEIRRMIREEDPPRPSDRISSLGAPAPSLSGSARGETPVASCAATIAANRKTEPATLSQLLRRDLDWIVMKCLEKDRTRRYQTAAELARDIERYLADEPVEARPPSLADRAAKWVRRHRPLVWSALSVFAIAVAALAASVLLIAGAYGREKAGRKLADEQWAIAENQEALAKQQGALAKRQKELADQQKQRAEANFAKARSAVDQFLNKVTEDQLLRAPGLQPLRRELLSSARKFYEDFVKEQGDDPGLQAEFASAHYRIGRIYRELGLKDESNKAIDQAVSLYEKLRQAGQESPEVLTGLANAYLYKGESQKTIELCKQVLSQKPGDVEVLRLLGTAYNQLTALCGPSEAARELEYHQQALAVRQELVRSAPDDPVNLAELANTLYNIGLMLHHQGRIQDALAMYQRAVEYGEKAWFRTPDSLLYGTWLTMDYRSVADLQNWLGQKDEALKAYQRVVQVRRKLVVQNPAVPGLNSGLYTAYQWLAKHQRSMGKEQDALRSYRLAREILENLPQETPQDLYAMAAVYGSLAEAPKGAVAKPDTQTQSERAEYAGQALDALKRAIAAGFKDANALKNDAALDSIRDREQFKKLLALLEAAAEADRVAQQATRDDSKLAARQKQADTERKLLQLDAASLDHQATLAVSLHAIGLVQLGLKKYDEAEKSLREASQIREAQHRQKPQDAARAHDYLATRVAVGELYLHTERLPEGHKLLQESLRATDELAAKHPDNAALQQQLAVLERTICDQYAQMGLWDAAALHSRRNLARKRTIDPDWDVRFAHLLGPANQLLSVIVGPYGRICELDVS